MVVKSSTQLLLNIQLNALNKALYTWHGIISFTKFMKTFWIVLLWASWAEQYISPRTWEFMMFQAKYILCNFGRHCPAHHKRNKAGNKVCTYIRWQYSASISIQMKWTLRCGADVVTPSLHNPLKHEIVVPVNIT